MRKIAKARKLPAAVAAVVLLSGLVGCSVGNSGGATTCGAYLGMSSSKQTSVVTKMMQDHGDATPNGAVTLTKMSVWAYCQTMGSNSSTIDGIYG